MNFAEQPPSKQWAALKYRGERFAEVWFKPEGEPFALTFRIPQESFRLPGMDQLLTVENLLKAVGITTEQVESWGHEAGGHAGADDPGLRHPLSPPHDVAHLTLRVSLKPAQTAADEKGRQPEVSEARWQDLEARWQAILVLEASIETLRISMETLRGELETASSRGLTPDEKAHAPNADVAQFHKAKNRIVYALPKVKEFVHRSTWATAAPERKGLEEIIKTHVRPRIPFAGIDQLIEQLESLLKDRQVMSALGNSVYQECKAIAAEVQGALRTLQGNAAANAAKKRGATVAKGRSLR